MGNAKQYPSTAQVNRDRLECVQGEIGFTSVSAGEGAREGASPGYGHAKTSYGVTIRNARPILKELSLDREGFTLIWHASACAYEGDASVVCKQYVAEMIPFIQDYFKAAWVMSRPDAVFLRRAGLPVADGVDVTCVPGVRIPLNHAHIDYMPIAGPMLAARENQLRGIPIRSYRRLMIVNTWRAFSPPPQDFPLAVCDSSTVADSDIVGHEYTDKVSGSTWWTGGCRYSSLHRWYYFPEMTADELLVWKSYDSEQYCKAVHSAFDNRRASPNAKTRESIEARFYVYYS
jgi:hypothetical protein